MGFDGAALNDSSSKDIAACFLSDCRLRSCGSLFLVPFQPAYPESPLEIAASIHDVPSQHIFDAQVDTYNLHTVLTKVSQVDKKAVIWSAFAAKSDAVASFVSMMV
jgi:hypothetical protein